MPQRKIAAGTVASVKRLLAKGFSYREIAKLCDTNHQAVGRIAREGKPVNRKGPKPPEAKRSKMGQCPEHGMIELPCRICQAIQYREQHPEIDWRAIDDPIPSIYTDRSRKIGEGLLRYLSDCDVYNERIGL